MKTRRIRKGKRRRGGTSYARIVSGKKNSNTPIQPPLPPQTNMPTVLQPPLPPPTNTQTVLQPPSHTPIFMGQRYYYNPLESDAFIQKYFGIEETTEGIEKIRTTFGNPDNNLCRHMMNFFPAFSIEPAKKHKLSEEDSKKFRTIVCSLLYIFGTFTKYLYDDKKPNKIILKGGTALKLLTSNPMNPNPNFKYDSEDIDILVTGKGAEDFANDMVTYIKWIYAAKVPNETNLWYYNSILQIEPQTRGLKVIKLYFVTPEKRIAICDIEYKEERARLMAGEEKKKKAVVKASASVKKVIKKSIVVEDE